MNACRIFNIEFVTAIDFVLQAAKNGLITAEEAKTYGLIDEVIGTTKEGK